MGRGWWEQRTTSTTVVMLSMGRSGFSDGGLFSEMSVLFICRFVFSFWEIFASFRFGPRHLEVRRRDDPITVQTTFLTRKHIGKGA